MLIVHLSFCFVDGDTADSKGAQGDCTVESTLNGSIAVSVLNNSEDGVDDGKCLFILSFFF